MFGQDYRYHLNEATITAIKDYRIGVFYIWGASEKKWEAFRSLARSFPKLLALAKLTERPFIYKVGEFGRLRKVL